MNWFEKRKSAKYLIDGYGASDRGMLWYNFCIYIRLPLSSILVLFELITQLEYITDGYFLVAYIIELVLLICAILCCYYLPILDKKGYYFLLSFLILNMCLSILSAYYVNYSAGGAIVFDILQIIYFYKRRDILQGKYNGTDTTNNILNCSNNDYINNDSVQVHERIVSKQVVGKTPYTSSKGKTIYCKHCGSVLDENKKCTGCGKQYFKIPKIKLKTLSMATLFIIICFLGYMCFSLYQKAEILESDLIAMTEERDSFKRSHKEQTEMYEILLSEYTEIKNAQSKSLEAIKTLREERNNYKDIADYWNKYGAITVDSDKKCYHTYSCFKIQNSPQYYVDTKWDSENMGYKPCPYCH